jgi:drug/metabolite transporter (DMT)-like permease
LAAFTQALTDALTKRYFGSASPYAMALTRLVYALPWLLLSFFFIPWATPDRYYFLTVASAAPLEILAMYAYMKAIKVSPLSLTLPFLAFTPSFVILSGWVVLGEKLRVSGIVGIFLTVIGSYCLHLSNVRKGLLAPIRAVLKEPGSRLMLLVSFLYSVTSVLGKVGIRHTNPYFFGSTYFIFLSLLLCAYLPFRPENRDGLSFRPSAPGMVVGITFSVMIFSHMLAISQVKAAYMISLKRTSLLFGILFGAWWFKEVRIAERLLGALIMLVGVTLIGLSH